MFLEDSRMYMVLTWVYKESRNGEGPYKEEQCFGSE